MTSREAIEAYKGREQAYVKHELLTAYLERFMMILGQHFPRVLYVDCFAGPWGSTTDDYSDTSFGRAVSILEGCQSKLRTMGRSCEFRALFIEQNPEAFAELNAYAKKVSRERLTVTAWNGKFQDRVTDVASWIGNDFAFVLIDPKGYKGLIEPSVLAPLLRKRNVEALINYMWHFLSLAVGHVDKPAHRNNLLALYGEEICDVPPPGDPLRDDWLLRRYKDRLAEASTATAVDRIRTVSFPVEYPGRESTKYFLVHVTHSDLGVIKFAEASQQAAAAQDSVRFLVQQHNKEVRTGTCDLFPESSTVCTGNEIALTQPWLSLLPSVGDEVVVDEAVVSRMIEEHSCFVSELQRGAAALLSAGKISNLDMKRHRPKNVVHFQGRGERVRRLR